MHTDVVLSVTFQQCMETTFLSVTFLQNMETMFFISGIQSLEDVLSVTFQQCMETTFYQWRSYNTWRRRFISDVQSIKTIFL